MSVLNPRWTCVPALMILMGCGSEAPPAAKKAEEKKPLVPVSALSAVYKMYQMGRTWAADLEPLEVTSIPLAEAPAKDGNFGAWRAVFVSASKRTSKTFTFSLVEKGEQLHEGVFGAQEESFSGTGSSISFPMPAFRVDSGAALKTALEKGGEAFQAKNANLPVGFKLIRDKRDASPVWRVYWGANEAVSPFVVYINADTGMYLKTVK